MENLSTPPPPPPPPPLPPPTTSRYIQHCNHCYSLWCLTVIFNHNSRWTPRKVSTLNHMLQCYCLNSVMLPLCHTVPHTTMCHNSPVSQVFLPLVLSSLTAYSLQAEQPTDGYISIFHKYCCYIKYYNKIDYTKSLGYITDMSKCHGAGVWSMEYIILRFMLKNIKHTRRPVLDHRWFTTGR